MSAQSALEQAIAKMTNISALDKGKADRAVRRMGLETTEENAKVWLAMKAQNPSGHIKPADIHKHSKTEEVVEASEVAATVWVIRKVDFPDLPQKIDRKFLEDPFSLRKLPPCFQPKDIWVVSQAISRRELVDGMEADEVLEWKTSIAALETTLIDTSVPQLLDADTVDQHTDNNRSSPAVRASGAEPVPPPEATASAEKKKQSVEMPRRFLDRSDSEPENIKHIFESSERHGEAGRFVSGDLNDEQCLAYWCEHYIASLTSMKDTSEIRMRWKSDAVNSFPFDMRACVSF